MVAAEQGEHYRTGTTTTSVLDLASTAPPFSTATASGTARTRRTTPPSPSPSPRVSHQAMTRLRSVLSSTSDRAVDNVIQSFSMGSWQHRKMMTWTLPRPPARQCLQVQMLPYQEDWADNTTVTGMSDLMVPTKPLNSGDQVHKTKLPKTTTHTCPLENTCQTIFVILMIITNRISVGDHLASVTSASSLSPFSPFSPFSRPLSWCFFPGW